MFEWDEANTGHIARHKMTRERAEQAIQDPDQILVSRSVVEGDEYEAIVGAAADGLLLFVVYTVRNDRIRVVSARRAIRRERRLYTRR